MRLKQLILATATGAFLFIGCNSDDGSPAIPQNVVNPLTYENGILVLNQGNFGAGNASVSFISEDLTKVQNGIFGTVNEVDALGDTAQSIAFNGDIAYIVMNGSQKIEVVDRYTFESIATIGGLDQTDLLNPRYMAIANGKGYVTNWGEGTDPEDDFVAVINLKNNTVETKIPVSEGPERLLVKDHFLYVALLGGFNFNHSVAVVDATSNTVTDTITVGQGPNSLQLDADDNLWVMSGGKPAYTNAETAGELNKIDTATHTVTETFTFAPTEHPGGLCYENDILYYSIAGSIFKMDVSDTAIPLQAEFTGTNFYDMIVHEGKLYGTDAKDFASSGSLEIYDLSDNSLMDSKKVGINPGAVYYNPKAER